MPADKITTVEVSRGTTHDGPGLRTTVFTKGCPLRCLWCQNPESINPLPEIWREPGKCIGCGACARICGRGAVIADGRGVRFNRGICAACGRCVSECPAGAIAYTGKEWTKEALIREVTRDRHYYRQFGGGVTVSGGEPLVYADFLEGFFETLRADGINAALDTCGYAPAESLLRVLKHADALLYDIKVMDNAAHRALTGKSNERILQNLLLAADIIREARRDNREILLWIRTPLIPEATATKGNIAGVARFIMEYLPDVTGRWELCAFNAACAGKYARLGRPWRYENTPLLKRDAIDGLKDEAFRHGVPGELLVVTGMTAV